MTKSTITRERIEQYANDPRMCNINDEIRELARLALAAMDSEPVAYTDERNLHHIAMGRETSLIWGKQNSETGDIPLYRHAQPVLVVPDEVTAEYCPALVKYDVTEVDEAWARGFNACRAAMLQDEPVTTANKLGNSPSQSPIDHGYRKGCECSGCKTTVRICAELAGNSPVIQVDDKQGGNDEH